MILANLTKAIREQNWFAVVVEFLIVIAGVVIGFQISAWNEAKRDRAYERSLLESLHQEVSSLRQLREAEIQPVLDRSGLLSSLIRRVHGADRGGDVLIDECIALSNSHVFRQLPDVLPSLAELSTSGGKQVISDTNVRREILQFIQERTGSGSLS